MIANSWRIAIFAVLLVLSGCEGFIPRVYWGFERMVIQPRFTAFQANPFFSDGRAMRLTPDGTIARGVVAGPGAVVVGTTAGQPVDRIPVPLSRPLLERGRERYDIYCAACHGILGTAATPVAAQMVLRPPPSLHEPRIRGMLPGRLFQVVSEGYGLMPGYADVLTVEERWGVVAYVHALQLSQAARLSQPQTR